MLPLQSLPILVVVALLGGADILNALQQTPATAPQRLPARPAAVPKQNGRRPPAVPPIPPTTARRQQQRKGTGAVPPVQRAAPTIRGKSPVRPLPFTQQQQPPNGMIKQCRCAEIDPCKERYLKSIEPCLDTCRHHVISLGGNYEQVKKCFKPDESLLKAAMRCTEHQHENACSKQSAIQYVPKRFGQTLENAAMAEIDRMIGRMGLDKTPSAKKMISVSKKLFGCVKQCMGKREKCEKSLNCGLQLPSDSVVVQNTKRCAINSGFNTANAQQLCNCAVKGGVKDLKSMCQKIIIA